MCRCTIASNERGVNSELNIEKRNYNIWRNAIKEILAEIIPKASYTYICTYTLPSGALALSPFVGILLRDVLVSPRQVMTGLASCIQSCAIACPVGLGYVRAGRL